MKTRLIDVSHAVEHGMITYRGLPPPVITEHLSRAASRSLYAAGTEFHIGRLEMVANTGTYLDAPFHRYAEGRDLSQLPLDSLANLDGLTIRAARSTERRAVPHALFQRDVCDVRGKAVLVHTGWARHWRSESYFTGHPFLTEETARFLVAEGAALVGIDSYNIDDTDDLTRPAHTILLRAGVPIVEHLCRLEELPDDNFKFFAVPVKVKAFGTFPVRAFALAGEDA